MKRYAVLALLFICSSSIAGIDESYQSFSDRYAGLIINNSTLDKVKAEVIHQFNVNGNWFVLDSAMESHGDEMISSAVYSLNEKCAESNDEYCADINSIASSMKKEENALRP